MRVSVAALLAIVLAAAQSWAVRPYTPVHPDPVLEPWRWRSFPELHGLGLRCLAEDKDGSMWFGVDDGVRRYDGVRWTAHTEEDGILGPPVRRLCATSDGSVYAGTGSGISRFRDGVWHRFFPPEGDLPWPVYDLMAATDGSLWAGTGWGAIHFVEDDATLHTSEQMGAALRQLAPDVRLAIVPSEAVPGDPWDDGLGVSAVMGRWFQVDAGGIPGIVWELAPGGPGQAAGLMVGDRILRLGPRSLSRHGLYAPAGMQVVLRAQRKGDPDVTEVSLVSEPLVGSSFGFPVFDVLEDRGGAMWFGLKRGEIVRWAAASEQGGNASQWRLYTERDGLAKGASDPRLAQSPDGAIWRTTGLGRGVVNRLAPSPGSRGLRETWDAFGWRFLPVLRA